MNYSFNSSRINIWDERRRWDETDKNLDLMTHLGDGGGGGAIGHTGTKTQPHNSN